MAWAHRTIVAACVGFVAACNPTTSGTHYRPVAPMARPSLDEIERFRIDQDAAGPRALAVIALPRQDSMEDDPTPSPAEERPPLQLDDVLQSVENRFPLILAAIEEVEIAEGGVQSQRGLFDTQLSAKGDVAAQGFYENESVKGEVLQPLEWQGVSIFGGYKLGRGEFDDFEGGNESNEDGEFSAGINIPLLAGREIDSRRLALYQAQVELQQTTPFVRAKRLEATRKAALAYWKWVANGQVLRINEDLLELAENRQSQVEDLQRIGQVPDFFPVDNRQQVLERTDMVLKARQKLRQSAILLSLYLRASDGSPRIAGENELPVSLPSALDPEAVISAEDIDLALRLRPELQDFYLELDRTELELAKAENDLLPKLDLSANASQDVGDAVSTPDDKGPFEFNVGLSLDVPLQRNTAKGKVRSTKAKLRQIEQKLAFAQDSVVAEVRDAETALRVAAGRIENLQESLLAATRVEEAERRLLFIGQSNLLNVNLREQKTADAATKLVEATAALFLAHAEYRAAVGVSYDEALRDR